MPFATMTKPWKHPDTGAYYFRKVVPKPLRGVLGKTEYRIRLGSLSDARATWADTVAHVDAEFARAAAALGLDGSPPLRLTPKQIEGLVGKWYKTELASLEDHAAGSTPEGWDAALDQWQEAVERGKEAERVANDVDHLLAAEGYRVDEDTRTRLSERLFEHQRHLFRTLGQRAEGDWSKDKRLDNFPDYEPPKPATTVRQRGKEAGNTLAALFDAWVKERKPPPRTERAWRRCIDKLAAHLGNPEPCTVTKDNIRGWKDALVASDKLTPKTINDQYLASAKALFAWAEDNGKAGVKLNPAAGVKVATERGRRETDEPYTLAQAKQILDSAAGKAGFHRWIPLLLAYSGARINEVASLSAADVMQEEGIWFLRVREDAATGRRTKNAASLRHVPIHSAVIEAGFLAYVQGLPADGRLFPDCKPDRDGRFGEHASQTISRWVRRSLKITDPKIAPCHSFRHLWTDQARRVEMPKEIADVILGHTEGGTAGGYGRANDPRKGRTLATLARWMEAIPRLS